MTFYIESEAGMARRMFDEMMDLIGPPMDGPDPTSPGPDNVPGPPELWQAGGGGPDVGINLPDAPIPNTPGPTFPSPSAPPVPPPPPPTPPVQIPSATPAPAPAPTGGGPSGFTPPGPALLPPSPSPSPLIPQSDVRIRPASRYPLRRGAGAPFTGGSLFDSQGGPRGAGPGIGPGGGAGGIDPGWLNLLQNPEFVEYILGQIGRGQR